MEEKTKTRQSNWQFKMMSQNRCCICGKKALVENGRFRRYCLRHMVWHREYQRIRSGAQVRYQSLTYRSK